MKRIIRTAACVILLGLTACAGTGSTAPEKKEPVDFVDRPFFIYGHH